MHIADGGGYGAITGNTYDIKTMAVTPDSASGYTAAQIEQLFSWLDPGAAAQAGSAHTAASKTLTDIADSLVKHVQTLNQSWTGRAAQNAVGNFQQLHETAVGLAQASAQTGAVLSWMGNVILPWYKSYKAPSNGIVGNIESLLGSNPQDKAAQAVMARLNNRLAQGNSGLPPSVSQHLSINGTSGGHSGAPMTGGPATGGTVAAPAGVGGGGGLGRLAAGGGGGGSVGRLGGGTGGGGGGLGQPGTGGGGGKVAPIPVTHLAGSPPPVGSIGTGPGPGVGPGPGGLPGGGIPGSVGSGGGPGAGGGFPFPGGGLPGGGGTGGLGGDGAGGAGSGGAGSGGAGSGGVGPGGAGPGGAGPGGAGSGGGSPGGDGPGGAGLGGEGVGPEPMTGVVPGESAVMGPDGMIGMVSGDPGAAGLGVGDASAGGAAGADGAAAGTAESGMGFPMSGSAGGQRERERYRQAWMAEDADVWESAVGLVPALIGG